MVSVAEVQTLIGARFGGANQSAQRLVEFRILNEMTGQARHRRFRYDACVSLFDREVGA
jgi:hypothetical protein